MSIISDIRGLYETRWASKYPINSNCRPNVFFSFVARVGFDDQDNIVFSSAVTQFDELSTYGVFGGVPVALNTSKVLTRIQRPSL